tara:strand:- start:35180 stop:35968 length:789 start_codon:yes stop_codon:yes gene_type:complete
VKKTILAVSLLISAVSNSGFAAPDSITIPKAHQTGIDDSAAGDTLKGFSATPSLITDGDILLLPAVAASYEDVWLHWFDDESGKKSHFWKHRFASSISLNGEIEPENNEDLVQHFMSTGGNIDVDLKLGITAFGATYDGFSAYLLGEYSYLDTREFTSETDTQDIKLETALYGLGLGLKFQDKFYLGWEGGRATILGDEDKSGAFYQAVDEAILQRVVFIWALDKTSQEGEANYIQIFRSWGARDTDAEIGISFSRTFDLKF